MGVNVKVTSESKVSRVEVLVRIVYAIVICIVSIFVFIAVYILGIINFLTCLILAKRIATGFVGNVVEWYTKVMAYFLFVTDERPPFFPELK
jgi:hypothetical protein